MDFLTPSPGTGDASWPGVEVLFFYIMTSWLRFHLLVSSPLAGVEKFKGKIMHSREYKYPEEFRDKRIVVVGLGNSGVDISLDLSHTTKQVLLAITFQQF